MQLRQERVQNIEVLILENEAVSISVMPSQGAKISSLVDKRSGREWMWSTPEGAVYPPLHTGMEFPETSRVGADEMLPTIAPCRWRGRDLPDHGEAYTADWQVDEEALRDDVIATSLQLPISPLFFARNIRLEGNRVCMHYTLRNTSEGPYEYIWAFHGLLTIEEGDRIELPAGCRRVQMEASQNCGLGGREAEWDWPEPLPGIRPDLLDLGPNPACAKFFTEPLREGRASIINDRSGDRLTYEFDPAINDTVGIWMTRGAWNGYHHVALEPSNGAPDTLDTAVEEWKRHGSLQAGETKEWDLDIVVGG